MKQYIDHLKAILKDGVNKPPARAGMPGSISLFGYQNRYNLQEGFPLVTTKQMPWKTIVVELLWFLRGDTNIKYLIDNGVNIWNEDAYNYYTKLFDNTGQHTLTLDEFVRTIRNGDIEDLKNWDPLYPEYNLGDCGKQYGWLWRNWEGYEHKLEFEFGDEMGNKYLTDTYEPFEIDQIKNLINGLKNNPEGRRHIITAWNPATLDDMALNACHILAQFNCRPLTFEEKIQWVMKNTDVELENLYITEEAFSDRTPKYYLDCQMYQRSADMVLGVPFNISSYSLLTHLIAKICNFIPGDFIHIFGDSHIYHNHLDAVKTQIEREPLPLPQLEVFPKHPDHGTWPDHFEKYLVRRIGLEDLLDSLTVYDFKLTGYKAHEKIKAKLSTGLQ